MTKIHKIQTSNLPILVIFLFFSLSLISCGHKKQFDSPYSENNPPQRVEKLQDLDPLLDQWAPDQPLFLARTDVTLHDQIENRKYRFDSTIVFSDPDKMRVRGNHPLIGNLFEIIVDSSKSYIYLSKDRVIYEGTTQQLQQSGGIFSSLSPRELVDSIRVFHGLDSVLDSGDILKTSESKEYLYVVQEALFQTIVRKIRKTDGLVEEVLLLDPARDNKIVLKVKYWEYEFFGDDDQPFPSDMDISLPEYSINVRVEVKDIKLDPPERLRDQVVVMPRRIDSRFPLEALQYQESVLPEEN